MYIIIHLCAKRETHLISFFWKWNKIKIFSPSMSKYMSKNPRTFLKMFFCIFVFLLLYLSFSYLFGKLASSDLSLTWRWSQQEPGKSVQYCWNKVMTQCIVIIISYFLFSSMITINSKIVTGPLNIWLFIQTLVIIVFQQKARVLLFFHFLSKISL